MSDATVRNDLEKMPPAPEIRGVRLRYGQYGFSKNQPQIQ